MNDNIYDMINSISEELNIKKDRLLKERLFSLLGYELNVLEESKRRFTRIKMEYHSKDQSEHYYWNDGSEEGIRIISFYMPVEKNIMDKDYKINIGFTYN